MDTKKTVFNHEAIPYGSSPDGFIPAIAIGYFLQKQSKILVIGDFTKRDYNVLRALGKDVSVMDIVPLQGIEQFYLQSITEKTSFSDGFFDGIVLAEVIEHLFEDHLALQEINRILADNGTLVITVPYFSNVQDGPEYHVRVHSSKTISRLLSHTGFAIKEHFYRGIISRMPQKNKLTKFIIFGFSKILRVIFGEAKGLRLFRLICFNLEYFLGTHSMFLPLQKYCTTFGGIMKIKKDKKIDYMAIQLASFIPPCAPTL
jgi:SAM-dependent methyltransferase